MNVIQEANKLEAEAKRIHKETGRPYWQVEEEVFAGFWQRNPDWSPEATADRKSRWSALSDLPDFDRDTSRNGVE